MKKKKILAFALAALFAFASILTATAQSTDRFAVLMYHQVLDSNEIQGEEKTPWTISTEAFAEQMEYLNLNGFKTLTLAEVYDFLYNGKSLPQKSVLITFDDGYYSNIERAYPILQKYGFRATIFSITSYAEGKQAKWTPKSKTGVFISVETMPSTFDVFEYASHSHNKHFIENQVAATLLASHDEMVADIKQSMEIVNIPFAFSYPFGQHNKALRNALVESGVSLAFSSRREYVTRSTNPFKIPRISIYSDNDIDTFKWIVSGTVPFGSVQIN